MPARVAQPQTEREAWNVIGLAEANLRRLLNEGRVEEVSGQVVLLSPGLRLLAREGALENRQEEADRLATAAFGRVNLIVRESVAGNVEGAANVFQLLEADIQKLRACFPPKGDGVEVYTCVDHLEVAEMDEGKKCLDCGKALVARRIPYSVVCARSQEPTAQVKVRTGGAMKAGQASVLHLALTDRAGKPLSDADLLRSHSERVHVLLCDADGRDFQHVAAAPGNESGTYAASFTPQQEGDYHLWVHVVPASTALPEFLPARLEGSGQDGGEDSGGAEEAQLFATGEGLVAQVVPAQPGPARFRVGQTHLVRLLVNEGSGEPVRRLEPLWNAFAHVTMIAPDFEEAMLAHPVGSDITNPELRGGPELAFKLRFPQPGLWRLFAQIRVDGKVRTFPLRLEVIAN